VRARTMPRVDGVVHRWVRVRGIRLHVAEAGSGPDVVVLLHGFPQHWYQWRTVLPALADRYRVLAVDLRGFGWSDAPRAGYRKEQLADDVLALLDALRLPRVDLIGHDWGGWIGFLLCLRAPERVAHFLALGIVPPWPPVRPRSGLRAAWRFWYQGVLAAPVLGYLAHRTRWFIGRLLRAGVTRRDVWDAATVAAFVDVTAQPARARAGVRLYRTFLLRELVPVLSGRYAKRSLTVPTKLLIGRDDLVLRPAMADAYRPLPIELVPGCGHFIVDEYPELVIDRARDFFAATDRRGRPAAG
jgi:pimeloyl-ACP methyl ester carboxylesterase